MPVKKIVAGLELSQIGDTVSLAALVDFTNTHYVVEERILELQKIFGVKQIRLNAMLDGMNWRSRALLQNLGTVVLGYVRAYRREDEGMLLDALKSDGTVIPPANSLYDLLSGSISSREAMVLFGLNTKGDRQAREVLSSWEQKKSLVPDASGNYVGEQVINFALGNGRYSVFERLGYSGSTPSAVLELVKIDLERFRAEGMGAAAA